MKKIHEMLEEVLCKVGVSKETRGKVLEEIRAKEEAVKKQENEPPKVLAKEQIDEIINSVRKTAESPNCAIVLCGNEDDDESMENTTCFVKGKRISLMAMLTTLTFQVLRKIDVPIRDFCGALKVLKEHEDEKIED